MTCNRRLYRNIIASVLLLCALLSYLTDKVRVHKVRDVRELDSGSPASQIMEITTGQPDNLRENMEHSQFASQKENSYDVPDKNRPLNILFIIVDDLRPQFGVRSKDHIASFDKHKMHTPHIDWLSERSLVLTRTYAQYSLCGPSRASLMTSRRPDVTTVYNNTVYWRDVSGNFTTIPQYFKEHGYRTAGAGKVFHIGKPEAMWSLDNQDNAYSWSEPFMYSSIPRYKYTTKHSNWFMVPDNDTLIDDVTAKNAVKKLKEFGEGGKPFFLAVGLQKPHLSHACPERFFEHYEMEVGQFMFNRSWQEPEYDPFVDMLPFVDGMDNTELGYIPQHTMKQIRRAYFACVSYVDELVSELLRALKDNKLDKSTAVVLTSDHGYHLGDNYRYGKYSNHEIANRVPLMIHIPGRTDHGISSRSLTELVDLFPTLVEAAGLPPIPQCPHLSRDIRLCTDGTSVLRLIDQPLDNIKRHVFSQVQKGASLRQYSLRNNQYRFISAMNNNNFQCECNDASPWRPDSDQLYNLNEDPVEAVDVIKSPQFASIAARLRTLLRNSVHAQTCAS